MSVRTYFFRDRKHGLPFVVWAWTDGNSGITYITIRVQLLGTMRGEDISPKIIKDGNGVRITIKFPEGGEDTKPEYLLMMNHEIEEYDTNHPQYVALKTADRIINDALEAGDNDDSIVLEVDLPFPVDTSGFKDPHSDNHSRLNVGIFPLPDDKYPPIDGCPAPSVKFLHLHCEEKDKPKQKQKVYETNYFAAAATENVRPDGAGSANMNMG